MPHHERLELQSALCNFPLASKVHTDSCEKSNNLGLIGKLPRGGEHFARLSQVSI